jgi:hypothetical protein
VGITLFIHIPPPGVGINTPLPMGYLRYPPSPPVRMSRIGGTIPSVNQKKFSGKMTPFLKLIPIFVKKNLGKL